MVAISIKNLTKYYGKLKALDNISFDLKKGEFFGFLGPNGAGKTTTINVITGLSNFNNGEVKIFDYDVVKDYKDARRLIGVSQQEFNLDPFFNVYKILKYNGGFFGLRGKYLEKRIDLLLEQFNLTNKKFTDIIRLSGGMKRRLMIAKALIHEPKILILDEPTAGVDVELRHELWDYLTKINKEGTTIFLTTHYIEEAEKLCNRICIINKGGIVALDEKNKLKKEYGRDYVEIELTKKIKTIPKSLEKFDVKKNGNVLRVACKNETEIYNILKILKTNKISVDKFRVNEDSLENIYLKLTK